jgi:hypothetical protein
MSAYIAALNAAVAIEQAQRAELERVATQAGRELRAARGRLPRPPRTGFPALLIWRAAALPLPHPTLSRYRSSLTMPPCGPLCFPSP